MGPTKKRQQPVWFFIFFLCCAFGYLVTLSPLHPFTASRLLPVTQAQNTITIQGALSDETNRPVSDARVTLSAPGLPSQSTLSQADGKFSFTVSRIGNYVVTVRADGYRPASQQVTLTKPEETSVQLPLKPLVPSSLHVTLVDVQNLPLAGGIVTIKSPNDETVRRAIEAGRGEYYFGRLSSGIYELNVSVPGYETRNVDRLLINSDSTTEQIIPLARVSTIPLGERQRDRSFTTPRLPSNQVLSIYADRDASVWFATTQGVCRFNGQDFESSERTDTPLNVLAQMRVNTLLRDSYGVLWFGTEHGVFQQGDIGKPVEAVAPQTILPSLDVLSLCQTRDRSLWMGTTRGAVQYRDGNLVSWMKAQRFTDARVSCLLESRTSGKLWAATEEGLFRLDGEWTLVPLQKPSGGPVTGVTWLAEDANGTLWVSAASGLYFLLDDQAVPAGVPTLETAISRFAIDHLGNFWCVKNDHGVVVYDAKRHEATKRFPGKLILDVTADWLTNEHILSVTADREGQLWLGTDAGAIRNDVSSFVTFDTSRGLTDSNVRAIAAGPDRNRLWIGTSRSVEVFDGIRFEPLEGYPVDTPVRRLLVDRDKTLWIASTRGLFHWDEKQLTRTDTQSLPNPDVRDVIYDARRPVLWVAGVNSITPINPTSLKSEGEPVRIDGEVRYLLQSTNGLLWIATDRGVFRYDPATAELVVIGTAQGLESLDVRWILEQPNSNRFWFATGHGVEYFDGNRVQSSLINNTTEGSDVRSLFLDREGYLWAGLGDGAIRKFLPALPGLERNYKREQYDLPGSSIRSMAQTEDGAMWFATDQGLTRHYPNRTIPQIEISLEIDGAEIFQPSPVEVSAGKHRIKFRFTGISMTGNVAYQYRLNGKTPGEWKLVDAERPNKNELLRTDLPPGEYQLEVRAINRDLYGWNGLATRFIVRVDRPVYTKGWFLLLGATFLLGTGGSVWLIRRQQRREYILPPHLQTFQPIETNPFIVGNPIRQPGMFFGREDDFNYVRKKLEGAAQGIVIVFCGERRAGKSSILYQIHNGRLGRRFVPVFIDMQEMIIESDGELFQRMARLIADAVNRSIQTAETGDSLENKPALDAKRYGFTNRENNPFDLFREFIDEVLTELGMRRLVLLVDEYELFETKVENNKLNKEIFAFLAGLIDSHDRLSMIFTGSKKLEQRDRRYWREMLRRSLFRKVGYLSERDTERLIIEPVKDQVVYGRGMVRAICRLTAGQPFYTQVICQNIVDYLNEEKRNFILRSDLQAIIAEIVDNPLPQMIYFWEGLSDDEKLVLSLLAEILPDHQGKATAAKLARVILRNEYPVTLSENSIRLTLEELYRSEILTKDDEAFAYRIDLKRHWIKRSHSIWQVVREVKTL
ncbi:MAG: carboxypeptidase regulatory-like domain-containing protein [Blastocatellia bacterium]|nr:carboxypeptidase regulatory-like domain-containing protein [Blastocatellia bacterium]